MAAQARPTIPAPTWGDTLLARAGPAAVAYLAAVVALDLLGSHVFGTPPAAFDLDGEHNVPSTFSSAAFGLAALSALYLFHSLAEGAAGRTAALVLGLTLGFMAIDEWLMFHERTSWLYGVHWTVWYLPVVGTAIAAGARVSRAYPAARGPFAITLGLWVACGFLEMASWDPERSMQPWGAVLVEETMELLALLALLAGLVRALRVARA